MTAAVLSGAIATGAAVGPQDPADARSLIVTASVIVVAVFAYVWIASRLVKAPRSAVGLTDRLGGPGTAAEPEPLVDRLLRDLDAALEDRSMVRRARRRVRSSRGPRSPGPDR
jgi:hypothetical protein